MSRMLSRHSNNKDGTGHTGQVRVLIVGDSGVGKSSIVHLILHGRPIKRPMRTVGCSVNVKYFEHLGDDNFENRENQGGTANEDDTNPKNRSFFVELWDIAGHSSYQTSRSLFYNQINGVIFVYDISKGDQSKSLKAWLTELVKYGSFSAPSSGTDSSSSFSSISSSTSSSPCLPVPLLVIANKADVRERDPIIAGRIRLWQAAYRSRAFESAYAFVKKHRLLRFPSLPVELLPLHVRQTSPPGIVSCAREGKLDLDAVNSFFFQLIKRRYFCEELLDPPALFPRIVSSSNLKYASPPSSAAAAAAAAATTAAVQADTGVLSWNNSVENSDAESIDMSGSNMSLNTII